MAPLSLLRRVLEASQVVLFYGSNRVHLSNVASHVDDLDAHMRPGLDDAILVVGELRWGCVRFPSDIARDQLNRNEDEQRTRRCEETLVVDRVDDSVDRLALERPPDDSAVPDGELSQPRRGENPAIGYVKGVHDGDNVVVPTTGALYVLEQLAGDQIVHVSTKVGWVQRDRTVHVLEEKHAGRVSRLGLLACALDVLCWSEATEEAIHGKFYQDINRCALRARSSRTVFRYREPLKARFGTLCYRKSVGKSLAIVREVVAKARGARSVAG